jgi:hypothetical protein
LWVVPSGSGFEDFGWDVLALLPLTPYKIVT